MFEYNVYIEQCIEQVRVHINNLKGGFILEEIALSNNNTIKSTELVEIINEFRRVESDTLGRKYSELRHDTLKDKIKKK